MTITTATADGFEFLYAPTLMSETQFSDQLNRLGRGRCVCLAATFSFSVLIVIPNSLGGLSIHRLGLLRASTVGVVALAEKEPRLLKPKDEAPMPDRRELLKTICPKGRWASVRPA